MRKAYRLAAAGVATATALVVLAEAAFGGQFRLLTGVFPEEPGPVSRLLAPGAGPHATLGSGSAPGSAPAVPAAPGAGPSAAPAGDGCALSAKLVPTCGVLWGVAPAAQTSQDQWTALHEFEAVTGRTQAIFHAYHRGIQAMFPTRTEIAIAREPGHNRLLLINWRPDVASWAAIARGDAGVDAFIDRLAQHLRTDFPEPVMLAIHHEPENDVRNTPGSGYTALDYRAMYRYVVKRLRAAGVTNLVTVMVFMAYPPWNVKPWWPQLYPGNDMVDWVGWDTYAYSTPGYGYGDFAQMVDRTTTWARTWPGMYTYAAKHFPDKPLMLAEWGVFRSATDPGHQVDLLASVNTELARFPLLRAMSYFDTPNAHGHDTRMWTTPEALAQYRWLSARPVFQVNVVSQP